MKKIVVCVLCFALIVAMCPFASAGGVDARTVSDVSQALEEEILITYSGHGFYEEIDKYNMEKSRSSVNSSLTACLYSRRSEIYKIDQSDVLIAKTDNGYLRVEKIDFDVNDRIDLNSKLSEYEIDGKLAEDVRYVADVIRNSGSDATISLYTSRTSEGTYYYYHEGIYMRYDIFEIIGHTFGFHFLGRGVSASEVAEAIAGFSLGLIPYVGTWTSLGYTLFSLFQRQYGVQTVTGNSSDFVQVDYKHDITTRYVYAQIGGQWYLGYQGHRVDLEHLAVYQYYVLNGVGKTSLEYRTPSETVIYSPNYYTYSSAAINNYTNPLQEQCFVEIGNLQFEFILGDL